MLGLPETDPRMRPLMVRNPLGEDTACMRTTLLCGLLKTLSTNIKNGSAQTRAQLLEKGLNDSAIHEDVMIGAPDTRITGLTKDGREVLIFDGGEWAF